MRRVLLAIAIGSAFTSVASAGSFSAAAFSGSAGFSGHGGRVEPGPNGVRIHRLIGVPPGSTDRHHSRRGGGFAYAYPPDFYDSSYDIDRSWDSDSFNDWWHDRPDRAYPRWVWHNRNCSEDRMWWSGAGWRCTP